MRRLGRGVVDRALVIAAEREPDLVTEALAAVVPDGGPLAEYAAPALAVLLAR
jgi:hypothetical protein